MSSSLQFFFSRLFLIILYHASQTYSAYYQLAQAQLAAHSHSQKLFDNVFQGSQAEECRSEGLDHSQIHEQPVDIEWDHCKFWELSEEIVYLDIGTGRIGLNLLMKLKTILFPSLHAVLFFKIISPPPARVQKALERGNRLFELVPKPRNC